MKRLLWLAFFIIGDLFGISGVSRLAKNIKHTTQLCLNNSDNFGTTHFIVGYKERVSPVKTVYAIPEKKQHVKRATQKKHKDIRGGAELIDKNRVAQSFCSLYHDIGDIIERIISEAQKVLYLAAFSLTDKKIADLIVQKHKAHVDVLVIVDAGNMKHKHSKVKYLIENNVPVWRYNPTHDPRCKNSGLCEPYMHLKCFMVDDAVVVTGSANYTKAAKKFNVEDINVFRDQQISKERREIFEHLRKYCDKCTLRNFE
jgi:phosphatidylserine/phosphatidylglycerophosphate/cardiolipin synthase-like enzyme